MDYTFTALTWVQTDGQTAMVVTIALLQLAYEMH